MSFVASGIAVAGVGLGIYQAVSAPGMPSAPSASSASAAVANAQAAALPMQRQISAIEQQGGSLPGVTNQSMTLKQINQALAKAKYQSRYKHNQDPTALAAVSALEEAQKAAKQSGGAVTVYQDKGGNYISSELGQGFAGKGTADVEGELARQTAQNQIELQGKYGVPFAEQAAEEAKLADPQGYAARQAEYGLIQKQLDGQPPNPLATTLDQQIGGQVKAGSGFDPESQNLLDASIARANADRGANVSGGDIENELSTGYTGEQRLQNALKKGQAWVSSGQTPYDVTQRREQQGVADLASFVNGRSPESQFGAINGQGPAPYNPGQPGATMSNSAGAGGPSYATSAYGQNILAQNNQANGWMAGVSALMKGAGAVAQA